MSYSNYDLNSKVNYLNSVISTTLPVINSKISSLQVPSTPNELVVVDTITVADTYPAPNQYTTIRANLTTFTNTADNHSLHIDNTQVHIEDLVTNDELFLDHNSLIIVQPTTTHQTELLGDMLDFQTPQDVISCGHTTYMNGHAGFEAYDLTTGDNTLLRITGLDLNSASLGFNNTLDAEKWSGKIQTVGTVANATHYLNFSDSASTGYGYPQKSSLISCNPSTSVISANTFSGNATSSTSIALTADNTASTCFLTFSKTLASNSLLYIDNTTTPLTYVPSTSTLTATNFAGTATNASNLVITSDNTNGNYYIPFSKLSAGTNPLYVDDVTSPLTYNPSSGLMSALYFLGDDILPTTQNTATFAGTTLSFSGASSGTAVSFRNASVVITGGSNTLSALTITNTLVNGCYKIGILNSGSGNLTINTGLGTNIKTIYSGGFNISSGRYGWLTIDVVIINAVTTYIVNAFQLTN